MNVDEEDEESSLGSTLAGESNGTSGNITIRSDADNQIGQSKLYLILEFNKTDSNQFKASFKQ